VIAIDNAGTENLLSFAVALKDTTVEAARKPFRLRWGLDEPGVLRGTVPSSSIVEQQGFEVPASQVGGCFGDDKMANSADSREAKTLTRLLRRINRGEDPRLLRKEAYRLLHDLSPNDIALAEQSLIGDGYSVQLVQLLSATFMLMGIEEQSANRRSRLPANHLVRMVLVEHDVLRCLLAHLNDVTEAIAYQYHLTDVSSEFRKLAHIVEHLVAMKGHIEREDDVIFPFLGKYGRISLCRAVQGDHIDIRTEIDNLAGMTVLFNELRFEQFKTQLITITRRLSAVMREHLPQEDEILYPIALEIIDDDAAWEKMKAVCDEIGYCGLHL